MLNIKALLTNICNRLYYSNMFVVEEYSLGNATLASNAAQAYTLTITKEGYYPLGTVGYDDVYVSGSNGKFIMFYCYVYNRAQGTGIIRIGVQNVGSSSATGTLKARVLWVKI